MTRAFTESLESRRLFSSAVGPATVFDAAVRADQLHVYQDFQKFKVDAGHADSAMLRDAARIKTDNLSQAPTVKGLIATFDLDILRGKAALAADHDSPSKAVLADEKAILAEQKKLAKDHADASAVTADQAQLSTDRAQVKTDIDTALNSEFTGRENLFNTILEASSSITTAVTADTQATAGLIADSAKLTADSTNAGDTLSTDLQSAGTSATQLDTDLTASQSQQ